MNEYLRRGLMTSSIYHIVSGAGLVLFSVVGRASPIAAVSTNTFCAFFLTSFFFVCS